MNAATQEAHASEAPAASEAAATPTRTQDFIALSKPGIVRMCLITAAGGLALAPGPFDAWIWLSAIVGAALAVASANAFNMVWERKTDRLMMRTRTRPVAAGRIAPREALVFASVLGVVSLVVLALGTNWTTVALAAFAIGSYVLVYTPAKYKTPAALIIGAVPGAVPPLLGWVAVTGRIDLPGLVLFGILFAWQIPHFLAIALFQKEDYARAGIKIVPLVHGDRVAKLQAIAWAQGLLAVSMLLTPLGVTGTLYLVVAGVLGVGFLIWSLTGLRVETDRRWARGFFFASLVYLPALTIALVLDAIF